MRVPKVPRDFSRPWRSVTTRKSEEFRIVYVTPPAERSPRFRRFCWDLKDQPKPRRTQFVLLLSHPSAEPLPAHLHALAVVHSRTGKWPLKRYRQRDFPL